MEQPQIAELEINGKTVVSFPGAENAHPGSTKVYFSDGKRNFMIPLPAFQRKLLRDGEKGSGSFFAFTAISAKKGLHLKISVRDSERGPRNAHAPWEGDSIELFFDSSPLDNPQNIYAGERVKRLFLAPASANGLPEHKSASGMNAAHIRATISGSQDGYRAEVLIPWSELGMQSPGILGFDVKINNVTQKGKLSSEIWSGNKENHRFRHRYGLWYPTQKTTKENMEK